MKPKDYIKTFGLLSGWNNEKQKEFLNALAFEFIAHLEYNKAETDIEGFSNALKIIHIKCDVISNKIPYGIPNIIKDYFFTNVVISICKELYTKEMADIILAMEERKIALSIIQKCKKEHERILKELKANIHERKIALKLLENWEKEQEKIYKQIRNDTEEIETSFKIMGKWKKEQEKICKSIHENVDKIKNRLYEKMIIDYTSLVCCPVESFNYFGLSTKDVTIIDVMKKYKEMVIDLNFHKNIKHDDFIQLIEYKNKCLKWISQNSVM